jgi:NAD(P)-dependent dehydrogenase (short-subunit alcohol dehydrogenase family)
VAIFISPDRRIRQYDIIRWEKSFAGACLHTGDETVRGKICVITGASGGIGLATAARLGAMGARLVLVGHNRDKGEIALARLRASMPGIVAEMHYADLSQPDDIVKLADALLSTLPRIDVLLNNAGALFARRETTPDGLERTFALNHMGYFRLTAQLRARLVASAPARIVNVASEAHRGARIDFEDLQCARGYHGWKAYRRSKLANILFTRELARRLRGTGVTANCLHPGFVATGFGENNRGIWRFGIAVSKLVAAISVERGAETPLYVASSADAEGVSGAYFDKCRERVPDAAAQDDPTAAQLWEQSEKLAGFDVLAR